MDQSMAENFNQQMQPQAGDDMPEASLLVSVVGEILTANALTSSLLGYTAEKLVGVSIFELAVDPPGQQALRTALAGEGERDFLCNLLTSEKKPVQVQLKVRSADDRKNREIVVNGFPLEAEPLLRQLQKEIARLTLAEDEARQQEAFFRAIFVNAPHPTLVWQQEPNGEIRLYMVNQKADEFSAGFYTDFVGLTVDDVFSKAPHIASYVREAMASDAPSSVEFNYNLPATGEEKWIIVDFIRFSDTHLLNMLRDITDQKRVLIEEESARGQIELLREAMTSFTAILNIDQLKIYLMEYLKRLIPYDRAMLFLLEGAELECVAALGFADNSQYIGQKTPASNPQFEALNRNRQPLYLLNAEDYRPFQKLGDFNSGKAWLGVPLFGHGQITGYLSIYSHSPGVYGTAEADLAVTFAGEASIAIENARLFEQLQQMAITDGLTGVFNRRYFYELAEIEFRRTRRYRNPLALVILDIDNFKLVNDTYGHTVGDQVLRSLANCIRQTTRESDLIGRYGGEEFVVLMPETALPAAMEAAERLREVVESCGTYDQENDVHITISLGAAALDENCHSFDDLVILADKGLYRAKASGKNSIASCQTAKN